VRAVSTCEIWLDDRLVLRGLADLQSGPRGWRATVRATSAFSSVTLDERRYDLVLSSGAHPVRLDSARLATSEFRFLGLGSLPLELT
jgi:hypothetical protein